MSLSVLCFSATWPEVAALVVQIADRHMGAFGRASHAWSVIDRADGATSAATVPLTTDTGQVERMRSVGATVVLTAVEGDLLIDTMHDRLSTYRFMFAAQGDAFDARSVAVFGAALALAFEPCDVLCVARAWIAEANADALAWPTQFGALPRVLEPALPCPTAADLAFVLGPTQLGVYTAVPDAGRVTHLVALKVPTVQLRFKSGDAQTVVDQVRQAEAAACGSATRLFINNHWQVVLDVYTQAPNSGIYGTHLGQEDVDGTNLVAIRLAGLRLGISTHGFAEMLRVAPLNPSYLASGVVFATLTKAMLTVSQGLGRLFAYTAVMRTREPVPAPMTTGGIDLAVMPRVLESGMGSAAVVRAVTQVADVLTAVDAL